LSGTFAHANPAKRETRSGGDAHDHAKNFDS